MKKANQFIEIYSNEKGAVYQCNKGRCLWLDFNGQMTSFKILCFYKFKKKVDQIDLEAMADNPGKAYDYEIISPCGCDRCFLLSLTDAAALKDLLAGTKVMLDLNSILYERLFSIPA